ncbi:site-specific integrase [Paenibacillus tritici]|uniref:tyrosine-type recombinase/integrase n=1 Tax=Paenibacillus tritici TaxID=1873425 RepID=UPI001BABC75F|nr:tyrosine-type recombinase/integrase [Paenibacillus tritici]QUL57524.1 site-specific integrase [Paenibacillus tritici]
MAKKKIPEDWKEKYPGVREKKGIFTYRYSIPTTKNGKPSRKQKETPGFSTPKEAYDAGILIKASLLNKTYFEKTKATLEEYLPIFLDFYRDHRNVKEPSVDLRRRNITKMIDHFGPDKKVIDLDKKEYQSFLTYLKKGDPKIKKKGLAKNTLMTFHASALLFFDQAIEDEIIQVNPAKKAVFPSYLQTVEDIENNVELPKYMEKEELARFLKVVKTYGTKQEYNMFYLLAYTGLRLGELLALGKDDYKKGEKLISITKTLYYRGSIFNYVLNTPKTKSSIRKVLISKSVIAVLDDHLAWQNEYKMENRKTYYTQRQFLFVNNRSLPGLPESFFHVQSRMKYFLEIAKLIDSLTPHSFRHTHASLLAEAGEDLEVIQKRLGHKNDRTTRDIYLHVTKRRESATPDRFESFMESVGDVVGK